MKEFILIPKNMFGMLSKKNNNIIHINTKVNNKRKKEKLTNMWKTHLPPPSIPLTQIHIPDQNKISINNRDNKSNKLPQLSITDKLMLHFPNNNKLSKVKLLFNYFKNIIDEDGNIISPRNTDKNIVDIANTFLNINQNNDEDDLDLYKYLINTLDIPKSLIKNRNILKIIGNDDIKLPLEGFIKIKKNLDKKPKINKQIKLNKWKPF